MTVPTALTVTPGTTAFVLSVTTAVDGTRRRGHGLRFGGRPPVPCDDAQNQTDDPGARRRMT